jgi:hypothetical protein
MYEVRWKRSALDRVAELWLDAVDRQAITDAVDAIDQALISDPINMGESRTGSVRVLFEPPLGVFFEIDEQAKKVQVLKVWTF